MQSPQRHATPIVLAPNLNRSRRSTECATNEIIKLILRLQRVNRYRSHCSFPSAINVIEAITGIRDFNIDNECVQRFSYFQQIFTRAIQTQKLFLLNLPSFISLLSIASDWIFKQTSNKIARKMGEKTSSRDQPTAQQAATQRQVRNVDFIVGFSLQNAYVGLIWLKRSKKLYFVWQQCLVIVNASSDMEMWERRANEQIISFVMWAECVCDGALVGDNNKNKTFLFCHSISHWEEISINVRFVKM